MGRLRLRLKEKKKQKNKEIRHSPIKNKPEQTNDKSTPIKQKIMKEKNVLNLLHTPILETDVQTCLGPHCSYIKMK